MKKIYTLAALALLSIPTFAQSPFLWTATSYKGAFPVTDGSTGASSNNWAAGWTNWDPENTTYGTPNVTVNADITTNTTWTSNNVYQLIGNISVKNGAILTIQPGTVIRGDKSTKSCLIISRGAKIMAQGTTSQPIVFTSNEEPSANGRAAGDWGGLIILGNGVINTACATCSTSPNTNYIEGFATNFNEILYGGTDNNDNSGILSHVRIEFAGVALSTTPNSEINGLTMGGVGASTQLDHIQISFSGDDSFEWFGGAVDARYLVSFRGLDDDFDTDFGYAGRVQFGLIVRDKDISDAAGDSNGFESDNFNPGLGRTPITRAVFSNITSIGPKRDGSVALPGGEKFERAIFTRRNTAITIHNSIFVGWEKGWHVSGATTFDNYNNTTSADSLGKVKNCVIASGIFPKFINDAGGANAAWYNSYSGSNAIDTTTSVSNIAFVNAFPTNLEDASDFRLQVSSSAATGADFSDITFVGEFTGIEENSANSVLSSLTIMPNPARGTTKIAFTLTNNITASILVYDVMGKVVSTLSSETEFNHGFNVVTVNTNELSNGIYFVSFESNSVKETKKLIVNN